MESRAEGTKGICTCSAWLAVNMLAQQGSNSCLSVQAGKGEHPRLYLQALPKDWSRRPRPAKYWHCSREAFDMSLRLEQSRSRRGPARPCITHWLNQDSIHSVSEGGAV